MSSSEDEEVEWESSRAQRRPSEESNKRKKSKRKKSKRNDALSNLHQDENSNKKRRTSGRENRDSNRKKDIHVGIDENNKEISIDEVKKICHHELRSDDCKIVVAALKNLDQYRKYKVFDLHGELVADTCIDYICEDHLVPCITGTMLRFLDQADVLSAAAMDVAVLSMQKHPEDVDLNDLAFIVLRNFFVNRREPLHKVANSLGVLKSIIGVMQKHPDNESIQKNGCYILSICHKDMDDQQTMKDTRLLVIAKAMTHSSSEVRYFAAKLMQQLSSDMMA